ncbi:MAG: CesT family type III secretion system chaperone [Polyangiaceae bacterium]
MIANNEDLEALLRQLNKTFSLAGQGIYLVPVGAGQPPAALSIQPPVLVLQVQVGQLPRGNADQLVSYLKRLLQINADGLLHAAFALDSDTIVLSAALEIESLDANELEAVLSDMDVALSQHVPELKQLSKSLGLA